MRIDIIPVPTFKLFLSWTQLQMLGHLVAAYLPLARDEVDFGEFRKAFGDALTLDGAPGRVPQPVTAGEQAMRACVRILGMRAESLRDHPVSAAIADALLEDVERALRIAEEKAVVQQIGV